MKINYSRHIQALADRFGDAQAMLSVERGRSYTYRQYHEVTNQVANMIRGELGLGFGDFFVCLLKNDSLALLHFPTIFKGAATAAYCNYRDALPEQLEQIDSITPKVAFIENELLDSHYPALHARGITVVCMDPITQPRDGLLYFWDVVNAASTQNPDVELDNHDHTTLIRFTGGTTGKGKPAAYSLDNWLAALDVFHYLPGCRWETTTRTLLMAPISHGSALLVLPTLYGGGCTVTMNDPDLVKYCELIEREKITMSQGVPTLMYRMLDLKNSNHYDLSSLETIIYGAAPISPGKLAQLQAGFGSIFVQIYGSTEHCTAALVLDKSDHDLEKPGVEARIAAAGRVIPGIEVKLVDMEGQPVGTGEVGEIWLRSRSTIRGYYNAPEATAQEFTDGFWKSGDLARRDDEGYITVVDRRKDMIISGGFNVYAVEVEATISSLEDVQMAAVIGIPHEEWGESIHAEVVLREGATLTREALIQHVKDTLGSYKAPKSIAFVTQLPLSPVGKLLRRQVREKYWAGNDRRIG